MANYVPKNQAEVIEIVERILPRLQHANASVVLSAIRVLMIYMEQLNDDWLKQVIKKMSPPLGKCLL
jgi:AP-1 complex subunit beta-1